MLLALAVWTVTRRAVLVVAILFGLALAALDVREMVHQVNESRPSLIAVSVVLAVLHLLVTATAAVLLQTSKGVVVAAWQPKTVPDRLPSGRYAGTPWAPA